MFYLLVVLQIWIAVGAHSISKLQINNTASDVYEVKEDKSTNTIAFVNPKTDHQTFREIVYYHLIERPYGPDGDPGMDSEGNLDFDDTMRPFTNSHGYPFLESVEKEPDTPEVPVQHASHQESSTDNILEVEADIEGNPEDIEIIYYDEDEMFQPEEKPVVNEEPKKQENLTENTTESNDLTTENDDSITDFPVTTPAVEPAIEKKAIHARKLLFDRVKERYYSKTNQTRNSTSSSLQRRKREIDMDIPEAPKLGPLNYESLPPYIRNLISTENPQTRTKNHDGSDDDNQIEKIKHKMRSMIDQLKIEDGSDEQPKRIPRTYGMNLTEDHGFVWNNIWSEQGVHFNVEASESIEDQNINLEDDDKAETIISDDKKKSTETIDTINSSKDEKDNKFEEKHVKEIEAIDDESEEEPTTTIVENVDEEDKARKRKNKKDKDNAINDLLEDEEFWSWLSDWTSLYIDMLTEHMKELVGKEVARQIKQLDVSKIDKVSDVTDEPEKHEKNSKTDEKNVAESNVTTEKTSDKVDTNNAKNKSEDMSVEKTKDGEITKTPASSVNEKEAIETEMEISKNNDTKKERPYLIQAQNLYGNAVGGEKVTNIFIFYPNSDATKVIQEIENSTSSNNKIDEIPNITLDKRIFIPDEDLAKTNVPESHKEISEKANKDDTIQSKEDTNSPITLTESSIKSTTMSTTEMSDVTKEIELTTTEKIEISTTTDKIIETSTEPIKVHEKHDEKEISDETGKKEENTKAVMEDATKKDITENMKKETATDESKNDTSEKTTVKNESAGDMNKTESSTTEAVETTPNAGTS